MSRQDELNKVMVGRIGGLFLELSMASSGAGARAPTPDTWTAEELAVALQNALQVWCKARDIVLPEAHAWRHETLQIGAMCPVDRCRYVRAVQEGGCVLHGCPQFGRYYDQHAIESLAVPGNHGRDRRTSRRPAMRRYYCGASGCPRRSQQVLREPPDRASPEWNGEPRCLSCNRAMTEA